MIDDMAYHISAWHGILNDLGAHLTMEQVKQECYGKNHELLERIFPGRFSEEEKNRMSLDKERRYQAAFRPQLKLLPGLYDFLELLNKSGKKIAIGSAAIMFNIDFVLDNLDIRHLIDTVVSADEVANSKPDPETFLKCADGVLVPPARCLVFEDAPKGVEAAFNAEMDCVVITTLHTAEEFSSYPNVITCVPDYRGFL